MSEDIKQYVVSEDTLDTIAQKILSQPNNEGVDSITIAEFADKIPNVAGNYEYTVGLGEEAPEDITVEPEAEYDGIRSATVKLPIDTNVIKSDNIKSGITILGVNGNYAGDVSGEATFENLTGLTYDEDDGTYSKTYNPSEYKIDNDKTGNAFSNFTVKINPGDLDGNNILEDTTILGVSGSIDIKQTGDATIDKDSSYDEKESCYYTEVTPTNYGGLAKVTVKTAKTSNNLTANDITAGKFALGIGGTHICEGVTLDDNNTLTLTASRGIFDAASGKYWNRVNVAADTTLHSKNIVKNRTVLGVSGAYEVQGDIKNITQTDLTYDSTTSKYKCTVPIRYKDGTNNNKEQETGKNVVVTVPKLEPEFEFYASGTGVNQVGHVMLSNTTNGWVNDPVNYDQEIPDCQPGNICYDTTIAGVTGSLIPWNDSTVQFEVTSLSITGEHDKANFAVNLRNTGSNPNETVRSRTVTASNINVPFPGIMITTESFDRDVDFSENNKLYRILEVLGVRMDDTKYITVLAAEVNYTAKEMFGYTETTQTNKENWALSSNIKYRPLQSSLYKTAIPGSAADKYNVWLLELNTYYAGTISDNGDGKSFNVKATHKRAIGWQ